MDTRTKRPVRTAVSLGLGAALVATAGVVAVTPVVTALASQGTVAKPAVARPAAAALHATVVRTALPAAVNLQGYVKGVNCDTANVNGGCTLSAMSGSVAVKDGSTTGATPGTKTLDVWKFADTSLPAAQPGAGATSVGAASAVLEGTVGVEMTITIHNTLGLPVGLSIPQLDGANLASVAPATAEVPAKSVTAVDAVYTFTPHRAGTYVYQAGLTENGSRQTAMGLVGALVVRPGGALSTGINEPGGIDAAPNDNAKAYDAKESKTAYADEAVLVYTDVDSAMTSDPIGFNMRTYRADYHLINGRAYPDVPAIFTAPGHALMLRVVNGAILEKSPTILGTRFDEFAVGTRPLPTPLSVSGRLVQTGDTFDALVKKTADKVRYAIYDAPGTLRNGDEINLAASAAKNAPALGGGVVLIDSGFVDGKLTGAAVTKLAAAGQPGSAGSPLDVTAVLTSRDGGDVTKAELYVDSLAGPPVPITVTGCGTSCSVKVTLDGTVLGALTSGMHPMWVRAQTADSAWGPYALIKVRIDNDGPAVTQLTLSDPMTNAKTDLDITATLDERTTGGSMVTEGRYWISQSTTDTEPGAATIQGALTVNGPRLIASGDATISAAVGSDFANLADGSYQVYVQGRDDRLTWGKAKAATLVVDKTAPVTGTITLDPSATNGLQGSASKPGFIRIVAQVKDTTSGVTAVDGYLDAVKPAGNANGIYFSKYTGGVTPACPVPADCWTADMPLSWLAGKKADGLVSFYVVGTDAAGNRPTTSAPGTPATINIDRHAPTIDVVNFSQPNNFTGSPSSRTLSFTLQANDSTTAGSSGIASVQYWVGTGQPVDLTAAFVGASNGQIQVTPTFDLRVAGYYGVTSVPVTFRVQDKAGNVSQVTRTFRTHPILFENGYEPAVTGAQLPAPTSTAPTGWNLGSSGPVSFGFTAVNRLAGLQSLLASVPSTPRNATDRPRPAAYYAVDLKNAQLAGATMTTLHGGFIFSPRGVATRCLTVANVNTCAPKPVTIFAGSSGTTFGTSDIVQVQYGRASTTSRTLFRVGVRETVSGTSTIVYGAWTRVPATATFTVTVDWSASGGNSRPTVLINNTGLTRPGGTASSTNRIRSVGIGVLGTTPSANPGQTGNFLFDSAVLA